MESSHAHARFEEPAPQADPLVQVETSVASAVIPLSRLSPSRGEHDIEVDTVETAPTGVPGLRGSGGWGGSGGEIARLVGADVHQHGPGCEHLRRSSRTASTGALVGYAGGVLDDSTSASIAARRGSGRAMEAPVLRRMQEAFSADLSGVRIHDDDGAARLSRLVGARAFTTGQDVFFGRGEYAPASPSGARVLAHELAHTLQTPTTAGTGGSGSGLHAGGTSVGPRSALPTTSVRRLVDVAGADLAVDVKPHVDKMDGPAQALYASLVSSKDEFRFKSVADLDAYLKRYAAQHASDSVGFWAGASGTNLAVPEKFSLGPAVETVSELTIPLILHYAGGAEIQVLVFASKRRHLAFNFTQSKEWPAEAKEKNSIVVDQAKFRDGLEALAVAHGQAILARGMLHGYEPSKQPKTGGDVHFSTDSPELPNESFGRKNAVHGFPAGGAAHTPSQEEFSKLTILCSYLYGTVEMKGATKPDKDKKGFRSDTLAGWNNAKAKDPGSQGAKSLDKATAARDDLKKNLDNLTKLINYAPDHDPAVVAKEWWNLPVAADKGRLKFQLNQAVKNLFDICRSWGVVADTEVDPATLSVDLAEAQTVFDTIKPETLALLAEMSAVFPFANPLPTVGAPLPPGKVTTRKAKLDAAIRDTRDELTKTDPKTETDFAVRVAKLQNLHQQAITAGIDLDVNF